MLQEMKEEKKLPAALFSTPQEYAVLRPTTTNYTQGKKEKKLRPKENPFLMDALWEIPNTNFSLRPNQVKTVSFICVSSGFWKSSYFSTALQSKLSCHQKRPNREHFPPKNSGALTSTLCSIKRRTTSRCPF